MAAWKKLLTLWHGPAVRLAFWYAAILVVLSITFSVVLYQLAQHQLIDSLHHQYTQYEGGPRDDDGRTPFDLSSLQPGLDDARQALILKLLYFNLGVLVVGGFASYWLAKRTLRPIEEALEAQTRFTADASHELRTPLAVMRTEIEVARADKAISKQEALDLLDSNLEEVNKLHGLAEALLSLARANHKKAELKPVSIKSIADQALRRTAGLAKTRDVVITLETSDATVPADEQGLVELIVILLDNAIKYSPAGGEVKLTASRRGHYSYLSVEDHGRGIGAADLPHIYERFYRGDKSRSSRDVTGHGLGLSIAQKIAEMHDAEITVKSQPGQGTVFTVKIKTI